jgi:hypothetical protein
MLLQKCTGGNQFTKVEEGYPLEQATKRLNGNIVPGPAYVFDLLAC